MTELFDALRARLDGEELPLIRRLALATLSRTPAGSPTVQDQQQIIAILDAAERLPQSRDVIIRDPRPEEE